MPRAMPSIVVCMALLAGSMATGEEVAPPTSPKSTGADNVTTPGNLLVTARMFEVNRTKMQKLGIDFARAGASADQLQPGKPLFDMNTPPEFLLALVKHDIAKEIDGANLLLKMNGKPAEFFQGGTIQVPQGNGPSKPVRFGTEVKVVAEPAEASNVRVQINFKHSKIDNARGITRAGAQVPGFRVKQVNTRFQSEIGKTVVFSGLLGRNRADGDLREIVLMVTTEAADNLARSPEPTSVR